MKIHEVQDAKQLIRWAMLKSPGITFVQQSQRVITSHRVDDRGQGTESVGKKEKKKKDILLDIFDAFGRNY